MQNQTKSQKMAPLTQEIPSLGTRGILFEEDKIPDELVVGQTMIISNSSSTTLNSDLIDQIIEANILYVYT